MSRIFFTALSNMLVTLSFVMHMKLFRFQWKVVLPLPNAVHSFAMCYRHWEQLSNELNMQIKPKGALTFANCLEMGLQNHTEAIAKVAEVAAKEFSIEQVNSCSHL